MVQHAHLQPPRAALSARPSRSDPGGWARGVRHAADLAIDEAALARAHPQRAREPGEPAHDLPRAIAPCASAAGGREPARGPAGRPRRHGAAGRTWITPAPPQSNMPLERLSRSKI
jgi:hypothetical protein